MSSKKVANLKKVEVQEIDEKILPENLLNVAGFESVNLENLPALEVSANGSLEIAPAFTVEELAEFVANGVMVGDAENILNSINIEDKEGVLDSKRYLKGLVSFPSPGEILKPCIDFLSTTGGRLSLFGEKEQTNGNVDGTVNRSFGRLNLITSFDIDSEMTYEVGVLIAFDLGKPTIKVYRGAKVSGCLNLCVFSADDTVKFEIGDGVNMEVIQGYLSTVVQKIEQAREIVSRLKLLAVSPEIVSNMIGGMFMETVALKLASGTNSILRAVDLFSDDKSKYYYKQENFNAWQFYNGLTEYYGEKVNFFDIPEKTRDTFQLVHKYCLAS